MFDCFNTQLMYRSNKREQSALNSFDKTRFTSKLTLMKSIKKHEEAKSQKLKGTVGEGIQMYTNE